jgi:hypothetical protein
MSNFDFEIVDSSHLTDADWAEINKLKKAYETGGKKRYRQRSNNWQRTRSAT